MIIESIVDTQVDKILQNFNAKSAFFPATLWREQVNFQWDDDEARFVLDQNAELNFYSASILKQHPAGRDVATLGQFILFTIQPVFALSP